MKEPPSVANPPSRGRLEPIDSRRQTNTTEVSRRLLDYLLSGEFHPGDRLPSERRLAETLGVGRSVVREALKSLTLLGLVEVRQGDGTFLKSTESALLPQAIEWGLLLGAKRTRDLVEARQHLEVVVAGLAAQRRDEAQLARLREQVAIMRASRGDVDAFVAADVAFHLGIAEAAGNQTLFGIMTSVRSLLQVWISRVMHGTVDHMVSAREHAPILAAIEAGDPEAARAAMERHMAWALGRLEETLAQEGVDGLEPGPADPPMGSALAGSMPMALRSACCRGGRRTGGTHGVRQ